MSSVGALPSPARQRVSGAITTRFGSERGPREKELNNRSDEVVTIHSPSE
jgi:hypothetical protein